MKRILIIIPLLFSLVIAIFVYRDLLGQEQRRIAWRIKEKELRSRLTEVPILLYHNIDGKGVFSVDYETLRQHFVFYREKGVKVISLSELEQRIENQGILPEKSVVITFDDGYKSMYTKLMPLAKEFNYPITLFVYLDFIHQKSPTSLTWEHLREMDSNGIDIQCHTVSHNDLTVIADDDRIFREMYLSRRILEQYLHKRIDYLAFPFGKFNLKTIAMAEDCGYRRVFSTEYGPNVITRDNYCLRRHHIKKTFSMGYIEKLIM